jgi:hypothetical protein
MNTQKRPSAKQRIQELEQDNDRLKIAMVPMLALMADLRDATGEADPAKWAEKVRKLREGGPEMYGKLIDRLLSGSFEVRGAFFEMLLPERVKPPLRSDFDRALNQDR